MKTNENSQKSLRNARIIAEFTQSKLAGLINVELRTLQGYEQRNNAPKDVLERIAEACNAPHLTADTVSQAVILFVDAVSEVDRAQKLAIRIARNGKVDPDETVDWAEVRKRASYIRSACEAIEAQQYPQVNEEARPAATEASPKELLNYPYSNSREAACQGGIAHV